MADRRRSGHLDVTLRLNTTLVGVDKPSRIVTTRGIDSAKSRLCVTTTIVVPCFSVDLEEELVHRAARRRVEVAGRLVGEHELRRQDQRAREGDALLLAAGELARAVRARAARADLGEQRRARGPSISCWLWPWMSPGIITFSSALNSGKR